MIVKSSPQLSIFNLN